MSVDPRYATFVDEFVAAYATGPAETIEAERTTMFPIGRARYGFRVGDDGWIVFASQGSEHVPFAIVAAHDPAKDEPAHFDTFCRHARTIGESAGYRIGAASGFPVPDPWTGDPS